MQHASEKCEDRVYAQMYMLCPIFDLKYESRNAVRPDDQGIR